MGNATPSRPRVDFEKPHARKTLSKIFTKVTGNLITETKVNCGNNLFLHHIFWIPMWQIIWNVCYVRKYQLSQKK